MRRIRTLIAVVVASLVTLSVLAAPAGAQQLVDAGKEGDGSGGLAFALFAVMVFIIAGCMFFMDRVRRNRLRQDEDSQ
jgi:hypothetical protein